MPNTPFEPTWKAFEKDLSSPDIKKQHIATEAFDETRTKEMAVSEKARKWELDRKAAIMKDKPEYVKRKRAEETAPIEEFKKELKKGGKFEYTGTPWIGLIIVKVDEETEQTASGIYVPDSATLSNTGVILAEGGYLNVDGKISHPIKPPQPIMFKKGAGVDVELGEWGKCILMTYNDILIVFNRE